MSQPNKESSSSSNNNNNEATSQHFEKRPSVGQQSGQSSLSSNNSDETRLLSSNADYDHIRNTTLMFFLDRLYLASKDGQEARTLHDLSCLFGTRDFTKEMRQIVGASRNGLKKFLQSYPSLFTIDGDKVYLSQLKQDSSNSSVRDYNKEAVDYFTQKLLQFGTSLVPIRNLFGYRSQATQEVRHVSGKNTKEFKQFLNAHDDVFRILADEHVVLLSALKELEETNKLDSSLLSSIKQLNSMQQSTEQPLSMEQQPQSTDPQQQQQQQLGDVRATSANTSNNEQQQESNNSVMDPYLNKQFAHTIQNLMKEMYLGQDGNPDKITIEFLHQKILSECKNELFLKMVKTIDDLRVFLRMHPKLFKKIRSKDDETSNDAPEKEFVCLVTDEERREMEAQAFPSLMSLNSNRPQTLRRCDTNESNFSDLSNNNQQQLTSLPILNSNRQQQQTSSNEPVSMLSQPPTKAKKTIHSTSPNVAHNVNKNDDAFDARSIDSTTSSHNNSSLNGGNSSLRATAPPFVPNTTSKHHNHHHQQQMDDRRPPAVQRSTSNHSQPASLTSSHLHQHQHHHQHNHSSHHHHQAQHYNNNQLNYNHHHHQQQQHHQVPRNQTIDQHHNHHQQQQQQQQNRNHAIQRSYSSKTAPNYQHPLNTINANSKPHYNQPVTRQSSSATGDDLRARTVNIVREASNIISRIMTSTDAVAFDCKGYNLGFNGQITLIQFAWLPKESTATSNRLLMKQSEQENKIKTKQKPEVCIFDLITNPELAYCLKPLLESESIVKIVHDVRNKSNALHVQFDIMLNHVFDTQVANLVIQQQETGKPAYKSRYISMSKLCEIYGDESLTKYRSLIQSKTRHNNSSSNSSKIKDVNYWRTRPLSDSMVYESTMDVYSLVGGVYQNLKSKIKPEYKPLFDQLNLEGVLARIKPDEIRSVKKERKIDLEVIDLKRKLYSDSKSSIVLSNREIRLLRHIDLTEEVRQKIQQCKKVAKKLERLDMKAAQIQLMQNQSSLNNNDLSIQTNSSCGGSTTTSSSSSSSSTNSCSGSSGSNNNCDKMDQLEEIKTDSVEELMATTSGVVAQLGDMGNLMDSEMFDELKDKMIESSSSLLNSLKDEEDDQRIEAATRLSLTSQKSNSNSKRHHLEHSGSQCSSCGCNCHSSLENQLRDDESQQRQQQQQQQKSTTRDHTQAVPGMSTNTTNDDQSNDDDKTKQNLDRKQSTASSCTGCDKEVASIDSNKAVDMAVQCDLLG